MATSGVTESAGRGGGGGRRTKLGCTSKEKKDVTAGQQIATPCSAFREKPKGKKVAQYPSGQLLLLSLLPL